MWEKGKVYLFVLPAALTITILFFGGLIDGVLQSLGIFPAIGQFDFSFKVYRELFAMADFWNSLVLTFRITFLSTLAAGILGMFMAVCLVMLKRTVGRTNIRLLKVFFQLPMAVPHLAGAYLMVLMFMQSGWLSRILFAVGWIDEISDFPVLINEPYGWGIIMTYTWKEAPFIALMVYPVLLRIQESWQEVAQVFGANRWSFFKEILFPLLIPAWTGATFIVFAFIFSAFEIPFLLGVIYPKMISVLSYDLYMGGGLLQRPKALAINVILSIITGLLGILAYRMSKSWTAGEGKGW